MRIQPTDSVVFRYHSPLKDLYKQGKFHGLRSISGEDITKVSIDHIQPKSKGGRNSIGNYVLANMKENADRGNQNIDYYLDRNIQGVLDYIEWFKSNRVEGFDCIGYIQKVINTINRVSNKYIIVVKKGIDIMACKGKKGRGK